MLHFSILLQLILTVLILFAFTMQHCQYLILNPFKIRHCTSCLDTHITIPYIKQDQSRNTLRTPTLLTRKATYLPGRKLYVA
jgi:hypothetical protein